MSEPTRSQILKEVKEVKEEVRELRREKNWSQINHEEKVLEKIILTIGLKAN